MTNQERCRRECFKELPEVVLAAGSTALLVVDMQYGDAHMDYGARDQVERRWRIGQIEDRTYYGKRLEAIIPNIQRLQRTCRGRGVEVVFTRIQSMTADGRDRSPGHRELGLHFAPGSREAGILEEVSPVGDEMVFSKTCSSVFNGTNLHYVLTNMRTRNLVVVGVVTSGCVESTVRDAKDLGYGVVLVSDACATWSAALESASLRVLGVAFAKVKSTEDTIRLLGGAG